MKKIILYCFVISFLFLMVCSKSSFLYSLNDWVDANCFFTVGKGLFKGKILYSGLFDQKGPLLFFYYGIASLISYKSFLGVFILEVISFTVFLYFAYKLMRLYLNDNISMLLLIVLSAFILILPAFTHGGSAEEFVLPMLMYSLYSLVKFLKNPKLNLDIKFFLLNGIVAGLVLTIKFSLLGFWFAFMLSLFIYFLFYKKILVGILSGLIFLFGMLLPLIPWLIYFVIFGDLKVFFDSYVLFNILYYPHNNPLYIKLFLVFFKPLKFIVRNLTFGLPFLIGILSIILENKLFEDKGSKFIIVFSFLMLCFGVFFGGVSFRYYYLILTPFMIFGLIRLGIIFPFDKIKKIIYLMFVVISLLFCFLFSRNTMMMKNYYKKNNFVQYQFGKIINKQKDPTLLNYGFLDGGFYTVTGIVPNVRYFQKQNVSYMAYPYIIDSQNKVIKEKRVDFVITRTNVLRYTSKWMTPYLRENYRIISSICQKYEEKVYRYTLWQKK